MTGGGAGGEEAARRRGWGVERHRGRAHDLHAESASLISGEGAATAGPAFPRRVRILEAEGAALVLGSSQPESDIDAAAAAAAGIDVVRRRTGGGLVLVDAGSVVWIDLIIPAGDVLWNGDVRRATWWVGDTWASALASVGAGAGEVWRGGLRPGPWSDRVCFAGLGPGEVCLAARKVVGVSQRRTRHGALFQTAALLTWDPASLVSLLRLGGVERASVLADLQPLAAGVGIGRAAPLVDALLAALP